MPEESASVSPPLPPEPNPAPRVSAIRWLGWVVFISLAGGIAYLFYFSGYRPLIANSSSSSTVELIRRKLAVSRDARTIVLGNSAAAEGFRASVYNSVPSASGPALNLGVPSAHMFLFEKILDMALDRGLQPEAVVIVLTPEALNLSILGEFDYLTNDLNVLKVELNFSDLPRLRHHAQSLGHFAEQAGLVLLRPTLFSGDLRDFSFRPIQRLKDAEFVYGWLNSMTTLESFPETNNVFSICEIEPLDQLEPLVAAERQNPDSPRLLHMERTLVSYQARLGGTSLLKVNEFEMGRFRKMLRRFTSRVSRVFIISAPYYDPDFVQIPSAFRAEFARELDQLAEQVPGVAVIPYFVPECGMMMDTVHLNRHGELFSVYLREHIESALAANEKPSESK